jgi:predicted GIY-YIG superfamily endonuclease
MKLYVLKCEKQKYYIGKTDRINCLDRIQEHFENNGSSWTRKYKPIEIIETIETTNTIDEDVYTKKYMNIHGIDNVRGGSYTRINLPLYQIQALEHELKTINDTCFNCGKSGHYIDRCTAPKFSWIK